MFPLPGLFGLTVPLGPAAPSNLVVQGYQGGTSRVSGVLSRAPGVFLVCSWCVSGAPRFVTVIFSVFPVPVCPSALLGLVVPLCPLGLPALFCLIWCSSAAMVQQRAAVVGVARSGWAVVQLWNSSGTVVVIIAVV